MPLTQPSPLGDCVAIWRITKAVMLNLVQHLIESTTYETLNQVQGDKIVIATQSLGREEEGEGGF
jgi:hypothetical protein